MSEAEVAAAIASVGSVRQTRDNYYGYDYGYDYDDDDDDDDDYEGGVCGFTGAQCNELLAQGVKPWDDDAHAVLDALSGW